MSEKDNEKNILNKLTDESTDDVETSSAAASEKAEESEWEFASAPSLDTEFLTDIGGDDVTVAIDSDAASAENAEEKKPESEKKDDDDNIKLSKKTVKIGACAFVALIVIAVLAFFGIKYYTTPNSDEKMNPGNIALRIGDTDVSIGMYNYYYDSIVYEYTYYANYGYYDLDTTTDFATQFTKDDDGNEISWLDFFEQQTKERLKLNIYYYEQGVKAGIELTDEQKSNIDSQISNLATTAAQSGQSINEYIADNYGEYCGEATLRKFLEQYYIAGTYYYQSQITNRPTEEEVNAYFSEHEADYESVSFAILEMPYDTSDETTKAAAVQSAQDISETLTDLQAMKDAIPVVSAELIQQYISLGYFETEEDAIESLAESQEFTQTKSEIESTFSAEISDWLMNSETAVNSTMVYPNEDSGIIYIIMKTAEPILDDTEVYSVRHILIMPKSDDTATEDATTEDTETADTETADTETDTDTESTESTEISEEAWNAAYEDAQSILDEYNNGEKTELSFALLAEANSEDTGSTSAGQNGYYGGGYEGITLGQMVSQFEDWATDDSRRFGDVEIVKSDYGYHIMYFIFDGAQYLYNAQQDCATAKENEVLDGVKVKEKAGFKKVKTATPGDKSVAVASSGQ